MLFRSPPPAVQLPGAEHEIRVISARPKVLPAGVATLRAVPQVPLTWLTTSPPAAPQLPGDAHETELIPPVPGIRCAVPHAPLTWLTTKPLDVQHPEPWGTP